MSEAHISGMTAAATLTGAELVEVSQLSSSVTITASTISAQASDNSYNDSGSGFVAAGFAVGDRVKVTGFTGNAANNIFAAQITALTTGKMTIGGTDGDVIVDDAAGESVTITKWGTRRSTVQGLANMAPVVDSRRLVSSDISGTNLTFNVNSTSYAQGNNFAFGQDLDIFPFTHFRICGLMGTNEASPATVTLQMTDSGGASSPIHTGGNDLVLTGNSISFYDSGWRTRDVAASGYQTYNVAYKGSNGTVDLVFRHIDVLFKYDP